MTGVIPDDILSMLRKLRADASESAFVDADQKTFRQSQATQLKTFNTTYDLRIKDVSHDFLG
jgi:hypothetical protein